MENNEYSTLADEYANNIRQIEILIADCLNSRKKAKEQRRFALVSKLNSNLAILYRQRRELIDTENRLRNHNADKEDRKAG